MQPFNKDRQAFYDFWDDICRRCNKVEYAEVKLDTNGKQTGKFRRKVNLTNAWMEREIESQDGHRYAIIGFGSQRIHIGLLRYGHLTGPGPFVLTKPDTTVEFELNEWSASFTCTGTDFTISATISFS